MLRFLRVLGQRVLESLQTLGRASVLWVMALRGLPRLSDVPLVLKQVYNIGVLSLVIIILSAFSIGAVISLQFYTQLVRFGAESTVGLGVALTVLRELGPVVTALLFAGRAGSAITAEIGLMKTTEQLSSMEMMGVDPLHRIVAPRLWAGFFCLPVLTLIFSVVAILGGALVAVDWLGVSAGSLDRDDGWGADWPRYWQWHDQGRYFCGGGDLDCGISGLRHRPDGRRHR